MGEERAARKKYLRVCRTVGAMLIVKIAEQGVAARNRNTNSTSHHEGQQLNRVHHKRNPHHYSVQGHSQGPQGEVEVGVFNEDHFLTIQRKPKKKCSPLRGARRGLLP